MNIKQLILALPEVKKPHYRVSFREKIKWTLIVLIAFFVMSNIALVGLSENALTRFEYLAIILGAKFGSLMSLGIGPIVTASIVLQLLVGAKILNIDLHTHEGKAYFQGLQKLLAIFFTLLEAAIYVLMGGLQAMPGLAWLVIAQLFIAGLFVILMDEIVSKYGFGSGISLFILAGVASQLFIRSFSFIGPTGIAPVGKVLLFFYSLTQGNQVEMTAALLSIIATIIVFLLVVYVQSIRVEVPLTYARIRGLSLRWPLAFLYTSNIPVILTAALAANIQLFATLMERFLGHPTWLGTFANGVPIRGLAFWINAPHLMEAIVRGSVTPIMILQAITFTLFMCTFAVIFSVFWVQTSGMDARSQAENLIASGLHMPGFRQDVRVLESVLSRYIMPLAVMGGLAVGLLASIADLMGALVRGTALLLAVMIAYRLYQDIAQHHLYELNPAARRFIGG